MVGLNIGTSLGVATPRHVLVGTGSSCLIVHCWLLHILVYFTAPTLHRLIRKSRRLLAATANVRGFALLYGSIHICITIHEIIPTQHRVFPTPHGCLVWPALTVPQRRFGHVDAWATLAF